MRKRKAAKSEEKQGANLGFEAKMWAAADKLRGHMDAAEYKHVVLGLIFLKYISDAFQERYDALKATKETEYTDPEDRDEYKADNVFWVPKAARWSRLLNNAKQPTIGKLIDDAMVAIEKENPSLKGVLPKDYARPSLDKTRLGELIDLIGTIGLGDKDSRSKDILGRVYEYFLGQFANAEGKKGGEFYTPRCVVRLLVEVLAPQANARICDPCCGSGGMFVQSEQFIEAHGGRRGDIAVYGQELNHTTWRLCQMNLAIRSIEAHIAYGDSFHNDLQKALKADYVLANPPFNMSDWGGDRLREDVRWKFGVPPVGNANYAWIQHFIHHLSPTGVAGFVMANGSMASNQSGEGDIRRAIIEADLVACMVALPGQLFYTTPIPVCLWFVTRDKKNHKFRDRRGQTLFIDARKLGHLIDRTHRELTDGEIGRIAATYHAWRGAPSLEKQYEDISGFCSSATNSEIAKQDCALNPGRYVGISNVESSTQVSIDRIEQAAKEASVICAEVVSIQERLLAATVELSRRLHNIVNSIHTDTKRGVLRDLAVTSRSATNPCDIPERVFDLYSIPAFDAGAIPDHVLGRDILSHKLRIETKCILVSKLNPRKHRVWFVRPTSDWAICSTEFAIIKPRSPIYFDYLFLFCVSRHFQDHLAAHATGSTGSRQRVKTADLLSAPIAIPKAEAAEALGALIAPYRERIEMMPNELAKINFLVASMSDLIVTCYGDNTEIGA